MFVLFYLTHLIYWSFLLNCVNKVFRICWKFNDEDFVSELNAVRQKNVVLERDFIKAQKVINTVD